MRTNYPGFPVCWPLSAAPDPPALTLLCHAGAGALQPTFSPSSAGFPEETGRWQAGRSHPSRWFQPPASFGINPMSPLRGTASASKTPFSQLCRGFLLIFLLLYIQLPDYLVVQCYFLKSPFLHQ